MNRLVVRSAMLSVLLLAARSVSATPSELVYKCGSSTSAQLVFVPPPAAAAGTDYAPRMALRPGLGGWRVEDRSDLPVASAPAREPVLYLLDGRIVESAAFEQMSAKEIDSIIVTCSDAYHLQLGIEEGRTLIVAFSHGGSLELLRKEMTTIETMQAAFMKTHDRFATSLEELGWKAADPAWRVELTTPVDGSSWDAVGRHLLLGDRYTTSASSSRSGSRE